MSRKLSKDQRRTKQLRERRIALQKRSVAQKTKGYNVGMIRDFLAQLLLEVRAQHYENITALKSLDATSDLAAAINSAGIPSEILARQFRALQGKYSSALIAANAIDGAGVSEETVHDVARMLFRANIDKRDQQIGHLEALQELFDEALECATLPFGFTKDGIPIQPMWEVSCRKMIDDLAEQSTPDFEELLSHFGGHWITTLQGVEKLKSEPIIVATNDLFERPLVVYGRDYVVESVDEERRIVPAFVVPVDSPEELQFLVAAIHKYRGRHEYLGNYFEEF